jgi:hypothetical protein
MALACEKPVIEQSSIEMDGTCPSRMKKVKAWISKDRGSENWSGKIMAGLANGDFLGPNG